MTITYDRDRNDSAPTTFVIDAEQRDDLRVLNMNIDAQLAARRIRIELAATVASSDVRR